MSVKIRLKQTGSRNRRSFRVVVVDESKKRDGAVIENLGFINPLVKPQEIKLKQDRIKFWLDKGAQLTAATRKIINLSSN